ncbi:ABC transporter [Pilimelia terevasa]|uniref:ABC transporter n=1 Tax=Pilimelia terevasa TaxID=53372 RepID=A0A8J3BVF3_9ACTN|nr:GTPase domain-containing protein [Pilimelia terevasa]GGK35299.1 ABC transporter [Pilimelia terevasa]
MTTPSGDDAAAGTIRSTAVDADAVPPDTAVDPPPAVPPAAVPPAAPDADAPPASGPPAEPDADPSNANADADADADGEPAEVDGDAESDGDSPEVGDTYPLDLALHRLRTVLAGTAYPLELPGTGQARTVTAGLLDQLDDYLLPRLRRLDAPLLVVVGGSTGAGKSTLVNSLVGTPVTAAGVLRPTTRAPVLLCHPADEAWFRGGDLLPGLTRTPTATSTPATLHLVPHASVPAGLALLDAPDVDSVVDDNRLLAGQLLAAADLWLFVTTAARYADAVPWGLLRTAVARGTATALVLDRVPPEAASEVTTHLREMLDARDLAHAPLFVLPETRVDAHGLLAAREVEPVRAWLHALALDPVTRGAVVRQTLDGAVAALAAPLAGLAGEADAQTAAVGDLAARVDEARAAGRDGIARGLRDGTLLRGEVLARWQEFVGTGDLMRSLEAGVSRLRDRLTAALTGRPVPEKDLRGALEAGLADLLRGAAADAVEQAAAGWRSHPAGTALVGPELEKPGDALSEQVARLIRDWQRGVLDLVRVEGADKRARARGAAYAVNATSLVVMVAVFASTAFIPTGAEVAAGAGSAVAGQKLLEAIFGDQAIRGLAARARADLLTRADALLATALAGFTARLDAYPVTDSGPALRAAAAGVAQARAGLDLVGAHPTPLPPVEGAE